MTVMVITIKERTSEIGILRIIGSRNITLIKSIIYEIFIISFLGSFIACIISGIVLRYFLMENLFDFLRIILYIPFSILLTVFSGVIPAIKILNVEPVEALRYE